MALTDTTAAPAVDLKPENLKPATDMSASGAMIEPGAVEKVPFGHPAVDTNPRAGQPAQANQIDMNDPTISGQEAVEANLAAQAPKADKKA